MRSFAHGAEFARHKRPRYQTTRGCACAKGFRKHTGQCSQHAWQDPRTRGSTLCLLWDDELPKATLLCSASASISTCQNTWRLGQKQKNAWLQKDVPTHSNLQQKEKIADTKTVGHVFPDTKVAIVHKQGLHAVPQLVFTHLAVKLRRAAAAATLPELDNQPRSASLSPTTLSSVGGAIAVGDIRVHTMFSMLGSRCHPTQPISLHTLHSSPHFPSTTTVCTK